MPTPVKFEIENPVKDVPYHFIGNLYMPSLKTQFEEWLAQRPESIQKLARKYPPGRYIMRDGAPYGITAPGTKVTLYSYLENGQVGVIVMAGEKLAGTLAHERNLGLQHGKTSEQIKEIHNTNIMATIDPQWLEAIN